MTRLFSHYTVMESYKKDKYWEAAMYASANHVDNLISTIDVNGQQIDGSTDTVLALGDLRNKFEAFGWEVVTIS